jgi:hypothetical protein
MDALRKRRFDFRPSRADVAAKFAALCLCITLSSIPASSEEVRKPILIQGNLDGIFYDRFKRSALLTDHIIFSSLGGDAQTAMKIAKDLQNGKKLKTSLGGLCLSACAEILFPAAKKFSDFSLVQKPLIGFHHNSEIVRRSMRAEDAANFDKCWGQLNTDFMKFLAEIGRSSGSVDSQVTALAVVAGSSVLAKDCSSSRVKYMRRYWFPTSQQLGKMFPAGALGPVCADDILCFGKSLSVFGEVGDRFLIGNAEYTVVQAKPGGKKIERGLTLEPGIL